MRPISLAHTISDVRSRFTSIVKEMADDPHSQPVIVGSHRRPQVALVPYSQWATTPTMDLIRSKLNALTTLAHAHGLSTISVIGSVARGAAGENSDVDLVFDSPAPVSLFEVSAFEVEARELLGFPVTAIARTALTAANDASFLESEQLLF